MKYAIRTAGGAARKFYYWAKAKGMDVVSFADSNHALWGQQIDGVPIESLAKTYSRYREGMIDKVIMATEILPVKEVKAMARELAGMGIKSDDILFVHGDFYRDSPNFTGPLPYSEYHCLHYLEFHLTHRCNLNCAGCSHFVPIIPKDEEVDFNSLKKDLQRLRELVSHIDNIRIMGGEPLLSENVLESCRFTRNLFPYANIRIVTNGILVRTMKDDVIEAMGALDIGMDITCYPPMYEKYDEIASFLDKKAIAYTMDIRWGMCPVMHKDANHRFKHDNTSLVCECYNLYKGKLFPCPLTAYVEFFNRKYGAHFPQDEGTDIYKVRSFAELWEDVIKNKQMCDFCDHHFMTRNDRRRDFRLCDKEPKMEDWLREYDR